MPKVRVIEKKENRKGAKCKNLKTELQEVLDDLKASKLVLNLKNESFKSLCHGVKNFIYFSDSKSNIFCVNMLQAQEYFFSKNKDEFIKTTQVDTKTIFTAGVCKSLVVDGDFFKKEKLIDLMYFKNLYGKKILLIVTDSSVYTLLIAEENQYENNCKSPNYSIFEQKLKPTKLFDLKCLYLV